MRGQLENREKQEPERAEVGYRKPVRSFDSEHAEGREGDIAAPICGDVKPVEKVGEVGGPYGAEFQELEPVAAEGPGNEGGDENGQKRRRDRPRPRDARGFPVNPGRGGRLF